MEVEISANFPDGSRYWPSAVIADYSHIFLLWTRLKSGRRPLP